MNELQVWWKTRNLKAPKAGKRLQTLTRLNQGAKQEMVPAIIESLSDTDPHVRKKAISTLAEMGDQRAFEPLIAVIFVDAQNRTLAIDAIKSFGARPCLGAIAPMLNSPDIGECQIAAEALRKIAWDILDEPRRARIAIIEGEWEDVITYGQSAIEPLVATLRKSTQRMRRDAATALARIGSKEAFNILSTLLEDDSLDLAGKEIVAWILKQYCAAELSPHTMIAVATVQKDWASLVSYGAEAIAPLKMLLKNSDEDTRIEAVKSLVKINTDQSQQVLMEAWEDGGQYFLVRLEASNACKNTITPAWTTSLVRALGDELWPIRTAAAGLLQAHSWHATTTEERIQLSLACKNWTQVRNHGHEAIPFLVDALHFNSVGPRAASELAQLGEVGIDALAEVASDATKDLGLREMAAMSLADIGDARAIEPLRAMLADRDMAIRQFAVWTLERMSWQPQTNAERVAVCIAHGQWDELHNYGSATIEAMLCLCDNSLAMSDALTTLQSVLTKDKGRVPIRQLRDMASLRDARHVAFCPASDLTKQEAEICSSVRQTAKHELLRRGVCM